MQNKTGTYITLVSIIPATQRTLVDIDAFVVDFLKSIQTPALKASKRVRARVVLLYTTVRSVHICLVNSLNHGRERRTG
eukprot:1797632-Rhodomonas_salina.3